jgi:hypothetical protein
MSGHAASGTGGQADVGVGICFFLFLREMSLAPTEPRPYKSHGTDDRGGSLSFF